MFATMYNTENEGLTIELHKTLDEAIVLAEVISESMKTDVTIFDYDISEKRFYQFDIVKSRGEQLYDNNGRG